jgi:hypothetical protein
LSQRPFAAEALVPGARSGKARPRESGAGVRFSYKSRNPGRADGREQMRRLSNPEHRQRAQQHVAQRAAANPYPVISRAEHPPCRRCSSRSRRNCNGPVRKRLKKSAYTPRLCTGALSFNLDFLLFSMGSSEEICISYFGKHVSDLQHVE